MKNSKEIIRIGLILFAITAISALLLAFANKITAPVIEVNNQKKTEEAMRLLMKDASTFEEAQFPGDKISKAYIAKDKSGNLAGVCVVSSEFGYGGAVEVMTGIDAEGKVTGIDVLNHAETPGLGARADEYEFKKQFTGRTAGIEAVKGDASDNEISAMSGATITSKAVTSAVNNALSAAEEIMKEAK